MSLSAFYLRRDESLYYPVRLLFGDVAAVAVLPKPANTQYDGPAALGEVLFHNRIFTFPTPQQVRVGMWPDSKAQDRYVVGFLHESWPYNQNMAGAPDRISVWAYKVMTDRDEALKLRNTLAIGKSPAQITDLYACSTMVSCEASDLPFKTPVHWLQRKPQAPRLVQI